MCYVQAQAAQFAAVWLWRIADWTPAGQPLEAHSLTVTQMAFSSTGQHLLTVSRDRTFAIWERETAGKISNASCLGLCNRSFARRFFFIVAGLAVLVQ